MGRLCNPIEEGEIVFQDTFNYTVDRDTSGASAIFASHGWNSAKTEQDGETGANGYIYTVDSIPGWSGGFPAGTRCLCLEALPETEGAQTDFFIEYGDGIDPDYDNAIPKNAWIRFWYFINHSGSQLSTMDEQKFIYACNYTYPCHEYRWMFSLSTNSADPYWEDLDGSAGASFLNLSANPTYSDDEVTNTNSENPGYEWRMGQTVLTEYLQPNRWQEITLHLDTSSTSGTFEAWIQPWGGTKVKVSEFISGQNGFQWTIPVPTGHRTFRMPTTVGRTDAPWYDNWTYIQNFRIATSEAALD